MARQKNITTKTKAIASSGASALPENVGASVAVRNTLFKTLTPKEAFELNIHVRKGISGIADITSKMKLRIFTRKTMDEVVSGDLYNLLHNPYTNGNVKSLIHADVCSFYISGEFNRWKVSEGKGRPTKLLQLDPDRLLASPNYCRSYENLEGWYYTDYIGVGQTKGSIALKPSDVIHASNYNPSNGIRGLSILLSGAMEISGNYYLNRFNNAFFQNGCNTDIIVRFPKGTDKKIAKEWCNEWEANHSVFGGNGFKITAVIADELDIESPSTNARDGQFLQLREQNAEDISGLLGVPPSVAGFLSKTRFDTIDTELEAFAENTIIPMSEMWSSAYQTQLVDPHFNNSGFNKKINASDVKFSRRQKRLFEKLMDQNNKSDLIVMLDPDSLPIMAAVNLNKMNAIGDLADKLFMTRSEAAEYYDIELPDNPVRNQVWIPNNYINASTPVQNDQLAQQVKALQEEIKALKVVPEPIKPEQKELTSKLKEFYRAYRALVLKSIETKNSYEKSDVFALIKEHELNEQALKLTVHSDYLEINKLIKGNTGEELLRKVKDSFNIRSKSSNLKTLADNYRIK